MDFFGYEEKKERKGRRGKRDRYSPELWMTQMKLRYSKDSYLLRQT